MTPPTMGGARYKLNQVNVQFQNHFHKMNFECWPFDLSKDVLFMMITEICEKNK